MKKSFSLNLIGIVIFSIVNNPSAFVCGPKSVSKGDPSFQILKRCGELISKEVIGYTSTPDQRREMVIERWTDTSILQSSNH